MENIFYKRIEMDTQLTVDELKERIQQNTYASDSEAIRDMGFGVPVLILEGKFKGNAFTITPYITGSKGGTPVLKGVIMADSFGKALLSTIYRPSDIMIGITCFGTLFSLSLTLMDGGPTWPFILMPVFLLYLLYSCQKTYLGKTAVMLRQMLKEKTEEAGKVC